MKDEIIDGVSYAIVNGVLIIKVSSIILENLKSIEIFSEYGLEIALDQEAEGLVFRENYYTN